MTRFYFDASALVKRYYVERGSQVVNDIFHRVPKDRMMSLLLGAGEIISVLVRRRNDGSISSETYTKAVSQIRREVLMPGEFVLESATDELVQRSFAFIDPYSINATDAVVLRSALDASEALRAQGETLVLVTADARLVRAAQAEGLTTFNPESDSSETLDALAPTGGA